jgi:hypothetical protein
LHWTVFLSIIHCGFVQYNEYQQQHQQTVAATRHFINFPETSMQRPYVADASLELAD